MAVPPESTKLTKRAIHQAFVKAFLSVAILACAPVAFAQSLKIGVSLPLSGEISILSRQFLQGARLALDTLGPGEDVEIIEVDDGCDPDLAQLAAEDLRAAEVSIITGFLCNSSAAAMAEELNESRIPLVIAGARADYLLTQGQEENWNIWRMAPGENYGADAAFRYLSGRWQSGPWAVIDDGTIYGRTLAEALRARMEEAGQPPQLVETIRPGRTNMAALVRRLREAGTGAVFVAAGPQDVAALWTETGRLDSEMDMAGGEALAQLPWTEEAEDLRDGLLAVKEPDPSLLSAYPGLSRQMADAGIEPEPYAFLGYAAIELAMAALRRTPAETTEILRNTVFRTALGVVKFDEQNRNIVNRYRLYEWRDGGFSPVGEHDDQ